MTSTQDVTVTVRHVRKAALCMSGARNWFDSYGLSWSDFLENGISAARLDTLGDALADKVSAIAREEFANGREQ